jgi:hypothetical protein
MTYMPLSLSEATLLLRESLNLDQQVLQADYDETEASS